MRWSALLALAACHPTEDSGLGPDPNELLGLEVEPATAQLETGPDGTSSQQFQAFALLDDGSRVPLDVAAWSVSNSSAGAVDEDGLFTTAADNGGITWVSAEYASTTASATVTVVYRELLVEDGVDPALFEPTATPMEGDPWLYPEDGVVLPRGTPSVHFQWQDLAADAYRLHFRTEVTDITVLVDENGWESQAGLWQLIASTNAGGSVEVALAAAVGGQVLEADPLDLRVNRMDTRGTIYYWTSSLKGVSRILDGQAEPWWSVDDLGGWCIGCHAVSGGTDPLLAYSARPTAAVPDAEAPHEGWLEIRSLADPTQPVLTMEGEQSGDFKSFSPDGARMIATLGCQLLLFDARSGALLGDITPSHGAEPLCVAQAEYSPDGSQVAFTAADTLEVSWEIATGSLWLADVLPDGSLGEAELIVDPDALYPPGGHIAYFPAWSPDGAWLAFDVSTGDSYDDPDAELWVVSSIGGTPILLEAANQTAGLTNSWPRWSPLPDDDVLWLTFSSRRLYGYVGTEGEPQIWVAAFDPALAALGQDPSAPAFWLVGQDPVENNHVPVWVE